MLRGEPLYQKSTASTDGTKLLTFERPDLPQPTKIFVDKIAIFMNQEQLFALAKAYFIGVGDLFQTLIAEKRLTGNTLHAGFLFSPPVLWDKEENLKVFIVINSGTATVVEMKIYWSYEK